MKERPYSAPNLMAAALTASGMIAVVIATAETLRAGFDLTMLSANLALCLSLAGFFSIVCGALLRLMLSAKAAGFFESGARHLVVTIAAAFCGWAAYFLGHVARSRLSSADTQIVFVALAIFAFVLLLMLALYPMQRFARSRSFAPSPRTQIAIMGLVVIAFPASFALLSWEMVSQLSYQAIALAALPGIGAFYGALYLRCRWANIVSMALIAITVVASVFVAVSTPTQETRLAMHQDTALLRMAISLIPTTASFQLQPGARYGSCDPRVGPALPSNVGTHSDSAPNIILYMIDGIRYDRTTLSGYHRNTTPYLQRWSSRAAIFEQAFSPASSTRQTFRALFTGVYPSLVEPAESTQWGAGFQPDQPLLAEYLRGAGYRTHASVALLRAFPQEYGALRGFDEVLQITRDRENTVEFPVHRQTDAILDLIRERKPDDPPVFAWTHVLEAHRPYYAGPNPVNLGRGEHGRYLASIHFVDSEIGRLLTSLEELGALENTVVIITSDHGEAFGEHGNRLHGATVYQEETRVPLLFFGAGIMPGRYETPVQVLDVYPTIFALAGLAHPDWSCGRNLASTLTEASAPPTEPVFLEQVPDKTRDYFSVAYIKGDHAMVMHPTLAAIELFHLREDPKQQADLSSDDPELVETRVDSLRHFLLKRGMDPSFYGLEMEVAADAGD